MTDHVRAERDEARMMLADLREAVRMYLRAIDLYAGDDFFTADRRRPRLDLEEALKRSASIAKPVSALKLASLALSFRTLRAAAEEAAQEVTEDAHQCGLNCRCCRLEDDWTPYDEWHENRRRRLREVLAKLEV